MKALSALDAVVEKNDYNDKDNMRTYIINVHGMKSALANIGKTDLSAAAAKLEIAGREEKLDVITSETPAFISSLRALVEELSPKKETAGVENADEDKPFLTETLLAIKAACGEYDDSVAEKALAELRKRTWSQKTNELLGTIAERLLHSEFDEIVEDIDKFNEQ
jgi:HPt (histidine-containing phosphotransfer) domain-containing protein